MSYIGEANDLGIVNWKRIRLALEHENNLLNNRVTWLITTQGFLLAACGIIFGLLLKEPQGTYFKGEKIIINIVVGSLCMTSIAAIAISVYLSKGIKAAQDQHCRLQEWWDNYGKFTSATEHPPICGCEPVIGVTVPYYQMPYIFICIWGIIFFCMSRFFVSSVCLDSKVTILNSFLSIAAVISFFAIATVLFLRKRIKAAPANHSYQQTFCNNCEKFCNTPERSPLLDTPEPIGRTMWGYISIWSFVFLSILVTNCLEWTKVFPFENPTSTFNENRELLINITAVCLSPSCFFSIWISIRLIILMKPNRYHFGHIQRWCYNCERFCKHTENRTISSISRLIKRCAYVFMWASLAILFFLALFVNQDWQKVFVSDFICCHRQLPKIY